MAVKNSIKAVPMASFNSASVSGTYQPVITGGLAQPCFVLRITNNSGQNITISFDGVNDADFCFSDSSINIPTLYASLPNTFSAEFPKGTQVYIKGTAGTGSILVSGYYQPQGV